MKRNLILTKEERKAYSKNHIYMMSEANLTKFFLSIQKGFDGFCLDDTRDKISLLLRFYEEEFKNYPEKKEAYLTGLKDAFEIFNVGLAYCTSELEYEIFKSSCENIVDNDLFNPKLW